MYERDHLSVQVFQSPRYFFFSFFLQDANFRLNDRGNRDRGSQISFSVLSPTIDARGFVYGLVSKQQFFYGKRRAVDGQPIRAASPRNDEPNAHGGRSLDESMGVEPSKESGNRLVRTRIRGSDSARTARPSLLRSITLTNSLPFPCPFAKLSRLLSSHPFFAQPSIVRASLNRTSPINRVCFVINRNRSNDRTSN